MTRERIIFASEGDGKPRKTAKERAGRCLRHSMTNLLCLAGSAVAVAAIIAQVLVIVRPPITSRSPKPADPPLVSSTVETGDWTLSESRLAGEAAKSWSSTGDSRTPQTLAVEVPLPMVQRIATDHRGAAVHFYQPGSAPTGPHRVGDTIGNLTIQSIGPQSVEFMTPHGPRTLTFRDAPSPKRVAAATSAKPAEEMIPAGSPSPFVGAVSPGARVSERPRPPGHGSSN